MDFNAKVLVSGELDNLLPSFDLELTELILPRDDFYFIRFRRNSPTVSGKDTYYTLILTECEE